MDSAQAIEIKEKDVIAEAPPAIASSPERFINRELSWLHFNRRVLEESVNPGHPALERVRFLSISANNLDEFFMVRVAGIKAQVREGIAERSPDGATPSEQLVLINEAVSQLASDQQAIWSGLRTTLSEVGIVLVDGRDVTKPERVWIEDHFLHNIFPLLTPLAIDPAHPFPYISDLSLNLAVVVGAPRGSEQRIARVKVPPLLPRFVVMPDGERFVPVEQVIAAHLDRLFPGMRVIGQFPFRVTRNADPALEEEEAEDLRTAVQEYLQRRRRSPQVVRLEIDDTMSDEVERLLMRELELSAEDVYTVAGPLDLSGLWGLYELNRPDLKERLPAPVIPPALAKPPSDEGEVDIFRAIDAGDVLVHHPYESFASSVEAFVDQAVSDPDVLAIKQTLYRTSGPDSPIVRSLIRAAESGKQVVALVELTARFDEEANITWAAELEKAGVHVVYGVVGLKTHAKATLVVRRTGTGIRRYCHMGTGNYNSQTARLYEDIGLLSSDTELGEDLTDLFNYLTGYSRQRQYRRLLVAPVTLRTGIVELIRTQTHSTGRIIIKCNHLIDPEVIEALYAASSAGARIDLIVRSSCGVRPGIAGMSENIWVRSLVGRYLEHSRIYHFGDDRWYIGSADLMGRNLDGRIETVVPVIDPRLQARLAEIVEVLLADDVLASELQADGSWHKVPTVRGLDAQEELHRLAVERVAK